MAEWHLVHEWEYGIYPAWKATKMSSLELPASLAKAYINKKGRVTPEDWAAELANDDEIIENKSFWLLDFYTTIELLKEGMNPRLTGLGAMRDLRLCVWSL